MRMEGSAKPHQQRIAGYDSGESGIIVRLRDERGAAHPSIDHEQATAKTRKIYCHGEPRWSPADDQAIKNRFFARARDVLHAL